MRKRKEFNFKITSEDQKIIKVLRDEYSVNISGFLRTSLRDLYERLDKKFDKKQVASVAKIGVKHGRI